MRIAMKVWIVTAAGIVTFMGQVGAHGSALERGGDATCLGSEATMVGTPGEDELEGTADEDVILALGGDDLIRGGAGDDLICGGKGDDRIRGNAGYDFMAGDSGNDRLLDDDSGGSFEGGDGGDFLRGAGTLAAGPGNDVMVGLGASGSVYSADRGDDRIIDKGGEGSISYEDAPDPLDADLRKGTVAGWGKDTLSGMEIFAGSEHADVLLGSNAGEIIDGVGGSDRINGRGGDDVIRGRGILVGGRDDDNFGADQSAVGSGTVVRGGPGSDGIGYSLTVHADLREGIARFGKSGDSSHVLGSVENLAASAPGSVVVGDEGDNMLRSDGGTAEDSVVLRGRGGDDILGPDANDSDPQYLSLFGNAGDDTLRGGAADDELYGGSGDDRLRGERFDYYSPSDDFLDGGDGADDLDGGQGLDACVNGEAVVNCES
jgi:Ca2+-binding RTX toxin-like protein